jgi:hypothetical protein
MAGNIRGVGEGEMTNRNKYGAVLKELSLLLQKCFKFLNAFSFCCQNVIVLFIRESGKILQPIITLYSIQMVNYPSVREVFPVSLFPNEDMFKHTPARLISSRVTGAINHNITIGKFITSAFPLGVFFSNSSRVIYRMVMNKVTPVTPDRPFRNSLPAIETIPKRFFGLSDSPCKYRRALMATTIFPPYWFTAIYAFIKWPQKSFTHTYIITNVRCQGNGN